jgi:hypothetical protein
LPKGFSLGELLVSDEEAAMLLLRLRVFGRWIAAGVYYKSASFFVCDNGK